MPENTTPKAPVVKAPRRKAASAKASPTKTATVKVSQRKATSAKASTPKTATTTKKVVKSSPSRLENLVSWLKVWGTLLAGLMVSATVLLAAAVILWSNVQGQKETMETATIAAAEVLAAATPPPPPLNEEGAWNETCQGRYWRDIQVRFKFSIGGQVGVAILCSLAADLSGNFVGMVGNFDSPFGRAISAEAGRQASAEFQAAEGRTSTVSGDGRYNQVSESENDKWACSKMLLESLRENNWNYLEVAERNIQSVKNCLQEGYFSYFKDGEIAYYEGGGSPGFDLVKLNHWLGIGLSCQNTPENGNHCNPPEVNSPQTAESSPSSQQAPQATPQAPVPTATPQTSSSINGGTTLNEAFDFVCEHDQHYPALVNNSGKAVQSCIPAKNLGGLSRETVSQYSQ